MFGSVWNTECCSHQIHCNSNPVFWSTLNSCDVDQVCIPSPSEPLAQLSSTVPENVPSSLVAVDYELEEAFKECENQMAVLGMSSCEDTWTAGDVDRCYSVALPDSEEENKQIQKIEVKKDAGLSTHKLEEGCHGSDGARKNYSSASEEEVFSFRDYVLGKKETNTDAVRTEDIASCVTENHSQLSEQQIKPDIEPEIDTCENIPDKETIDSVRTDTQTISEIDAVKQTVIPDQSIQDVCSVKCNPESESTEGLKDSDRIYIKDPRAAQETNPVNEELMSSLKDAQIYDSNADEKIDATLTDKHACDTLLCLEPKIITQPNMQKQMESGTQRETVDSNPNNPKNKLVLPEQLSAEGKQPICFPSPEPDTHQAHLSHSGAPPVLIRHSPEVPDDRDSTDGPCKSISDGETIHHDRGSIGEVKHEKNVSVASAVVIDFGQANSAQEHEPTGSRDLLEQRNGPPSGSGADALTPVRGNSHSPSRAGAGVEEEESALEEIYTEFAGDTRLRATPTKLERIECEGEKRGDAYRSAAERESAVVVSDLLQTDTILKSEGTLSEITTEQELKCILTQISSSPVQRVEEKVESCDSRMPHNSTESEEKGGGLPIVLSPAGDEDTVSVGAEDKAPVTIFSPGVLGTCEWQTESSRSTERKREEEGSEEGGKGGAEHAAHVETCTSHSITASSTQSESRLIPGVTDDASSTLTIKRTNDCDSINPTQPPSSHLNITKGEVQKDGEACLSASGDDLSGSDRSLLEESAGGGEVLTANVSDQQVRSARNTNGDTSVWTETQQQTQAVSPAHEDTSPQPNMKNIKEMAVNVNGLASKSDRSFEDDKMLKCQVTECASLPPLMVFERLRQPVKETSFNFKGFLNTSKPPTTPGQLQNKEGEEQGAKNTPIAFEENENQDKIEKQEGKLEQGEIICNDQKDSREEGNTPQETTETSLEHIGVNIGKEVAETGDIIRNQPVILESQSTAGESATISNTKPVDNEILKEVENSNKGEQENAESSSVTQVSPKNVNESASTDKNSVIQQDVSSQENKGCEDCDIAVFEKPEQLNTTETNVKKAMESVLAESINIEHELKPEDYACEDKPQIKTTPDTDSTDPCVINALCLSQPDQTLNIEQLTTTSKMQILPTADEYKDKLPCQTESRLNDKMMTSAASNADDKTVPSPAAETSVPAQRDSSSNSTQSTYSNARDVSVIVLKTPGPLLSHCEVINDCDIALAEAGEHCSVDSVCDSHTEVVKDSEGDGNDHRCNANEEMLRRNADDQSCTVVVSTQKTPASRPEEGCGSLMGSKSPKIDENAKETSKDIVEGKKEECLNSEVEKDLCGDSITDVQDNQNSQSPLPSSHKDSESKPPTTLLSDPPSGHVSSTPLGSKLQPISNMLNSSVKSIETTCAEESHHSQSTSTTQQRVKDVIKCDLRVTQSRPHTSEEHVSSDDKVIVSGTTETIMPLMGGEQSEEPQGQKHTSSESNDFAEAGNTQNNSKQSAMIEQTEKTCKTEDNQDAHTFQEQDESTMKPGEHVDKTEAQKQELDVKNDKQLHQTIQSEQMQCDSVVTSEGCVEEDQSFKRGLSQSGSLFSQSQERHQQPVVMAAPEVELDVEGTKDKINGLESAEANNYTDTEVIVCCTAEAQNSVNNTSESFTLLEGNKRGDIVDITCPQNKEQSVQTTDLSGEKGPLPVCSENILRENTNQTEQVVKGESELVSLASEDTEKEDTEAKEEREHAVLTSQDSESKLEEGINSQNQWNEISDAKKDSEQFVSHSVGFSECPGISHHEAEQKTEESLVTHGDTEITLDSQNDVGQIEETPKEDSDFQPSTSASSGSASMLPENIKETEISVNQAFKYSESLRLCHPVEFIASLNSNSESETTAQTIDQRDKCLSEQIPDSTQNTEDQDTPFTKQQLTHLLIVDPESTIGTVTAEDTVLKKTQQTEINDLMENEGKNKIIGKKDHIDMSESLELVVEESRSKDKDNQSKLSVLLNEKTVLSGDGETACNVDRPLNEVGTLTEMKPPAVHMTSPCPKTPVSLPTDSQDSLQLPNTVSQESSQQATKSFVQSLRETATDMVNISSDQNPDNADSSIEDIGSVSITNTVPNNDINAKEKSSNVSEGEDRLLGSAQVSQIKNSLDIQCPGVIYVPESSGTVSSAEGSDWLRDLKDAAAMYHIIPEHKDETTCGSAENRYCS